jgi:hypothetical protein
MELERRAADSCGARVVAAVCALGLALVSCSGIHATSELTEDRAPERITSYAWIDDPSGEANDLDGALDASVRAAVEREFGRLGIPPAREGDEGVVVTYHSVVESRVRSNDPYFSFHTAELVETGTLMIELLRAGADVPFWRGQASSEIRVAALPSGPFAHQLTPTDRPRDWRVEEKIAAIFSEFPARFR